MVDKEGRLIIMNVFAAVLISVLVVTIYAALAPFSLAFKVDGEVAYTQSSVTIFSNYEKESDGSVLSEAVYGEDAPTYYYTVGDEKYVFGESNSNKLRVKMFLQAAKNLVTLKWADEDFVIELES